MAQKILDSDANMISKTQSNTPQNYISSHRAKKKDKTETKVVNLSNPEQQRNHMHRMSILESYFFPDIELSNDDSSEFDAHIAFEELD